MQQNTGPAGAEDNRHLAGGSIDCSELKDGGARGLACMMFGGFVAFEEVQCDAATAAAGAACGVRTISCDDEDVESCEWLGIAGEGAVGAGGPVSALNQGELCGDLGVSGGAGNGVECGCFGLAEAAHQFFGRAAGDQRRGSRGTEQAIARKIVGVGV